MINDPESELRMPRFPNTIDIIYRFLQTRFVILMKTIPNTTTNRIKQVVYLKYSNQYKLNIAEFWRPAVAAVTCWHSIGCCHICCHRSARKFSPYSQLKCFQGHCMPRAPDMVTTLYNCKLQQCKLQNQCSNMFQLHCPFRNQAWYIMVPSGNPTWLAGKLPISMVHCPCSVARHGHDDTGRYLVMLVQQ